MKVEFDDWIELIDGWNSETILGRDAFIEAIEPTIQKYASFDYLKGKKVNTPIMITVSPRDVAQDIGERLLLKHKSIKFEDIDHVFEYLRRMVYHLVIDGVRRHSDTKHGKGERVLFDESEEASRSLPDNSDEDYLLLLFVKVFEDFKKQHKEKAMAFSYENDLGLSREDIAKILNVSTKTVKNYIEFANRKLLIGLNPQGEY